MDTLMTTTDAARQLGVTRRHAWWLVTQGILTAQRVGGMFLVDRASVEQYARERKPAGRPKRAVGLVR